MTSTIQSMGNDVKAPANETMTLTRKVDIWSRMQPEQRELCLSFNLEGYSQAYGESNGGGSYDFYQQIITNGIDKDMKAMWDEVDTPYKFGAVNGRRTTKKIQEAHEKRPD